VSELKPIGQSWWRMCRRAYQRGYRVGRRGVEQSAGPPFLKIPITRDLFSNWRQGYAHGLERYDEQENGQSLRKMKAVGGVQ
jgi:hypothetical protein